MVWFNLLLKRLPKKNKLMDGLIILVFYQTSCNRFVELMPYTAIVLILFIIYKTGLSLKYKFKFVCLSFCQMINPHK